MKKLTIVLVCVFVCLSAFAVSVEKVLPSLSSEELFVLRHSGSLSASSIDGQNARSLVPELSMMYSQVCSAENHENSFNVVKTEFVAFPESWKVLSEQEKVLKVYNILLSISSQKGLTYESHGKIKTLFEESYCVDSESSKIAVNDPVVSEVPIINSVVFYQKDNRFGGNFYSVDYLNKDNEIFMSIANKNALKFMGVTCVEENKLSMFIDAFITDDGVIISSMAEVFDKKPVINILVYKVDLADSFERRITALCNWFTSKVE